MTDSKLRAVHKSTPLLDKISTPADLRRLPESDLPELARQLRAETIDAVSTTGGHLGAGLGVVELTIALHYIFDTPDDVLIWDVGHQAYPHKILTGRRDKIRTLRQWQGLSGFTKRAESPYDPFGAAHASTSISAGLGFAAARDLKGDKHNVVCVIGDGAMSGGMAYEAMNNAGSLKSRLIVVLNDNDMSIAPPAGAMSAYLARLISSRAYRGLRGWARALLAKVLPKTLFALTRRAEEYARGMAAGGTLFEEMGFYYVGPVDGHNFRHLLPVLRNVRAMESGPVLIHAVTHKGHGYQPAEQADDKYHGVSKFNIATGAQQKSAAPPSCTAIFADTLTKLAARDKAICAITAAMPAGTGLDRFAARFPERCFDVGIAEQHAVTFAAGLAAAGMKPFAAIYSTFLQRAYDQIIHDVAIQKLPVRFAIDRAGLVGADGATHAGSFDIPYLAALPHFIIMAAGDSADLAAMCATAAAIDDAPCAFRYPRGQLAGEAPDTLPAPLEIGRGRIIREGQGIALVNFGSLLAEAEKAAALLAREGIEVSLADARFVKPLDENLLRRLAGEHHTLITLETGAAGGFGARVAAFLGEAGFLDGALRLRMLTLPDRFIDQAAPEKMYQMSGLDAASIARSVLALSPPQKRMARARK